MLLLVVDSLGTRCCGSRSEILPNTVLICADPHLFWRSNLARVELPCGHIRTWLRKNFRVLTPLDLLARAVDDNFDDTIHWSYSLTEERAAEDRVV